MITIEEKLAAIASVNNGELLRNVAADYGVGVSNVSDGMKMKNKFEEHASKLPDKIEWKRVNMKKFMRPFLYCSHNRGEKS